MRREPTLRDAREPATCTYEATLGVPVDCGVLGMDSVPIDAQLRDLVKGRGGRARRGQ